MRNKKFIIGFLIFDAVAVLIILFVLIIHNPFKTKVAPDTDPTTASVTTRDENNPISSINDLDFDKMKLVHTTPSLIGMREESALTSDGKYYTAYRSELDLDLDGDGELESVSISLDDHSESFYVLVNDQGVLTDYVIPGTEFAFREEYQAKACKGAIRGCSVDLDSNDPYTEVFIELTRDSWEDYKTIMVRYDGSKIHASVIPGVLSAVSNAGTAQFSFFDEIYGVHKLYRTYDITSDEDFLKPQTDYFFADTNVEKTSYTYILDFDIQCKNLQGQNCTLRKTTSFYWCRTDNETYVDVITTGNYVYRLPITKDEVEYESGSHAVFHLGDHEASEIVTRGS
ncbi:MAG: hypothetical protein J6Y58_06460 [Clostridiales bacterium]|nr:hypothetical protein [Clostridiales bacterium]